MLQNRPSFSIVIPTYNRKDTLRRCLAATTNQDYSDYEVIVVDDASTDGTDEMVRREFPQVRYLRQERNRGPAAARNQGIRAAAGEIVAFTDDDCLVPPDFLSRLADGYQSYPEVTGVGGYLEPPEELIERNIFARYDRFVTRQIYHAGQQEYLGGFECPAGGTHSMSYRKSILEEVGGFDKSFPFAAGEDADLKWRVCQRGLQLLYLPVRVVHLQPYNWETFRKQQITRGRGVVHFERKYGELPGSARVLVRSLKRSLLFPLDVLRLGPGLGWVKLMAGLCDAWGQWIERERLSIGDN